MPAPTKYREAAFDENGNSIDPNANKDQLIIEDDAAEGEEPIEENNDDAGGEGDDAAPAPNAGAAKYRIGDKEFATQQEAMDYANSTISTLDTNQQLADAYRQGVQDVVSRTNQQDSVTPAAEQEEEFDQQLYYENPAAFLKQFGNKIATKVKGELTQAQQLQQQEDQLWGQFTQRHADLADFRKEVNDAASQYAHELRVINATKGAAAAFDFVALKVKANFQRYAQTLKPNRPLQNNRGGTPPQGGGQSVTPKGQPKKVLSFQEQIAKIKPKRR